jgi:hypothetical protein
MPKKRQEQYNKILNSAHRVQLNRSGTLRHLINLFGMGLEISMLV